MEKIESNEILNYIESFVSAALLECASREDYCKLMKNNAFSEFVPKISDDLLSFTLKDPAAKRDPIFILKTYTAFSAVMHYRVSHWICRYNCMKDKSDLDDSLPALLFRRGKLMSGAEIHFRSEIGNRLILDHGFGTVIGETAVIGDDCYLLGGVTLGARGICGNRHEFRHPVIGNRVQIGAFTSVLGRIRVGDDVFIGPHCTITKNIPDGAKVKVKSSMQVIFK